MNIEHFQRKLLEKQRECQAALAAFEEEAIVAGKREVRDSIDDAAVSGRIGSI